MKLYEITAELTRYTEELDSDEQQLTLKSHLDGLQIAFENKVEQICKIIREKAAEQVAIDMELGRLKEKQRVSGNAEKWLRNYLKINMEASGIPLVKTSLFGVSLSDSRPRVDILTLSEVPTEFVKTEIVRTPNKEKIFEHFKSTGEIPPGCEITQGKTLRIT